MGVVLALRLFSPRFLPRYILVDLVGGDIVDGKHHYTTLHLSPIAVSLARSGREVSSASSIISWSKASRHYVATG